jgi:transaldolase
MFAQGWQTFSWIPNAYMEQAAAVYAATTESSEPVYGSPSVGRLDDRGENGMDLVGNIKKMYQRGDGHVHVLSTRIRSVNHLLCSFALGAELATVPGKALEQWAAAGFPLPDSGGFSYKAIDAGGKPLKPIVYKELDLGRNWESFDIAHELTTQEFANSCLIMKRH